MRARVNGDVCHPDEHTSDEELVRMAQRDPEQFGLLYERYAGQIEGFIRSRVNGNHALAQDLTSQAFTKAFAALPRYQDGPFSSWLYQIARNTVIDNHRRRHSMIPIDEVGELVSPEIGPDEHAVAGPRRDRIREALEGLKPQLRDVVKLRLHGLTNDEIGERLGMSRTAVKSAQYRAFNTLRQELRAHQ